MERYLLRMLVILAMWLNAVSAASAQTNVEYIHTDALGTPVAVTNSAGVVIERSVYEPYGQLINRPLTDGPGFTGHVQDAATGLTYMQQRYYDPQVGLFLSVDPVTAFDAPVGLFNRYRYANGNPYKFLDPDGRAPCVPAGGGGGDCHDGIGPDPRGQPGGACDLRPCNASSSGQSDGARPTQWMQPGNWEKNVSDPLSKEWSPFSAAWDASTSAGDSAAQSWADAEVSTGNSLYAIPGVVASLWTPSTAPATATVLSVGSGLGAWSARPYWQYYPAGDMAYRSTWLTRGLGWKPPYAVGAEARSALALPQYNSATAVRAVYPRGYVRGPRQVKPQPAWGHPSPSGIEYRIVPFTD